MAASEKKIAEGKTHLQTADKALKTGFLKWKPDYDTAVSEYTKAAVCFKNAKAHNQCIDAYILASGAQKQQGSAFHAAKSLESAALICKDLKEFDRAVQYIGQASDLFLEHGTPDTAAIVLEKAAKMVEQQAPDKAIALYLRAADVGDAESRPRQVAESTGKAARLYIRTRKLDEAAETLQKEMDFYAQIDNNGLLNKLVMGVVLVHLHRGDSVAAQKALQAAFRYPGFIESEEAGPVQSIIEAYDAGDQETANQIVSSPLFKFMENDFTKLARDLKVPGGKKKPAVASGNQHGDPATVQDKAEDSDSDEEIDLK